MCGGASQGRRPLTGQAASRGLAGEAAAGPRSPRAAELARRALSLCGRCGGAHGTNWNVQTADRDVTKRPARLASPAGGAAANPGLRIPPRPAPPLPVCGPGARAGKRSRNREGECSGRQLRGAGSPAPRRAVREEDLHSLLPAPHFPDSSRIEAPSPLPLLPKSFHCIPCPSPAMRTLFLIHTTSVHLHSPHCPSPCSPSLLGLTLSAFPPRFFFSSAGLREEGHPPPPVPGEHLGM